MQEDLFANAHHSNHATLLCKVRNPKVATLPSQHEDPNDITDLTYTHNGMYSNISDTFTYYKSTAHLNSNVRCKVKFRKDVSYDSVIIQCISINQPISNLGTWI